MGRSKPPSPNPPMNTTTTESLPLLLDSLLGTHRRREILDVLEIPEFPADPDGRVGRARLAMALAVVLFEDVCRRVTMANAYVTDLRRGKKKLVFDHGALRTVTGPCGDLPSGRKALARILEPLGYTHVGTYPLERLALTGYVFAHADLPADIPQYFVSEFHPERFSPTFRKAVRRVVETSRDPLPAVAQERLDRLAAEGSLEFDEAARLLPDLVACFGRHHDIPTVADYELLACESEEMAWISTEGQIFNHATDRVADVHAVAETQRELGRPIKETVEASASGRVFQTAFRAQSVERLFRDGANRVVPRTVPGSFHEFITRKCDESGKLDLAFDASNAQGIFVMTRRGNV